MNTFINFRRDYCSDHRHHDLSRQDQAVQALSHESIAATTTQPGTEKSVHNIKRTLAGVTLMLYELFYQSWLSSLTDVSR